MTYFKLPKISRVFSQTSRALQPVKCCMTGYVTKYTTRGVLKLDICTLTKTAPLILNSTVLRTRSEMRAALFLVSFLLAVGTVSSKSISYGNCTAPDTTPENGELTAIDVSPCDEDPCVLKRGGNATLTINFTSHEDVIAAKIYAWVFFGLEPVAVPLPSPDACQGHGLSCPLKSGVQVELVSTIFISEFFPSGSLKVDVGLSDQNGKSIICGKVAVELV